MEFVDREAALRRVEEWARRGTQTVRLIYGPEGCGKTAWLRQSAELLRELGFDVIYVNPLQRDYLAYIDLKEVVRRLAEAAAERSGVAEIKLADLAVQLAKYALSKRRKKIAILADDVFKAIGYEKAAAYVKWMVGVIEYPPGEYESIIAVVATSEGVTRREIGRHRWASHLPMWNMPLGGFVELYGQLPGAKPPAEVAWRLTGGNPSLLSRLYEVGWDAEKALRGLITERDLLALASSLNEDEKALLRSAVDDPDVLMTREGAGLLHKLVDLNLVLNIPPWRDEDSWLDAPPPERDLELGVGRHVAWQTPLHREAVRRALG